MTRHPRPEPYNNNPGYAAIGIYEYGKSHPTRMSSNNRVIVFDTPRQAFQFMPQLGEGRITRWKLNNEEAYWLPMEPGKVNRACILTGYDVYNLPPGMRSETKMMAWRYHVPFAEWYETPDRTMRGQLIEQQKYIEALLESD